MIDKNSPIPIYYQLEQKIKQLIESQKFVPGDFLPSERELAEKYNISRMTVRQAINNLVTEGLLYREKGKGTFVCDKKFEQDLSGLTSFSEEMYNRGLTPSSQLLNFQLIYGIHKITSILNIESSDLVYEIKRIRFANDEPVALETTYTPQKRIGTLDDDNMDRSFYEIMEKNRNFNIAYGEQSIEASLANDEEIKYLKIHKGDPVLIIKRTTFLQSGKQPIEYTKSVYRADKYKFNIRMPRNY
ncbi:GntR family transcriptional regulator [Salinibacillus kushneri]|uniref:GntR family transcriptional regulator n=1 Tax=Salinibacillus kushneri TaxID=237682 RepID=A0A1H9YV15_9BACI|nr:GntR family transcriptional regulator [Salinibacillus kushneri]SES73027.1 GntR family transcriptional regulator [Salinibacillus kushneri]